MTLIFWVLFLGLPFSSRQHLVENNVSRRFHNSKTRPPKNVKRAMSGMCHHHFTFCGSQAHVDGRFVFLDLTVARHDANNKPKHLSKSIPHNPEAPREVLRQLSDVGPTKLDKRSRVVSFVGQHLPSELLRVNFQLVIFWRLCLGEGIFWSVRVSLFLPLSLYLINFICICRFPPFTLSLSLKAEFSFKSLSLSLSPVYLRSPFS